MSYTIAGSPPRVYTTSRQLIGGDDFNKVATQLYSTQLVTASTVQTQAAATQINAAAVSVTTANANDAVKLPLGYAGLEVFISNLSANILGVFPSGTDQINGGGAGTVLAQTASKSALYKCLTNGPGALWYRILTA